MEGHQSFTLRSQTAGDPVTPRASFEFTVQPDVKTSLSMASIITPPTSPTRPILSSPTFSSISASSPMASDTLRSASDGLQFGILQYPISDGDYEIQQDCVLGSGRFSNVYLARQQLSPPALGHQQDLMTPPVTPTSPKAKSRPFSNASRIFAVKIAVDRSTLKALKEEAKILSYLAAAPDSADHIAKFHGFDSRYNAIVFSAYPMTLEYLINDEMGPLDHIERNEHVTALLPHISQSLVSSLAWLHGLRIVHADIKPSNILLQPHASVQIPMNNSIKLLDIPFTPVLADFTSSFMADEDARKVASLGGGTYDYMAPELLSSPYPPPDFKADVYALAVSFTQFITGASPFKEAGTNRFAKMAMIKDGNVLNHAARDPLSETRLQALRHRIVDHGGFDIFYLLKSGLCKSPNERPTAAQWFQAWSLG